MAPLYSWMKMIGKREETILKKHLAQLKRQPHEALTGMTEREPAQRISVLCQVTTVQKAFTLLLQSCMVRPCIWCCRPPRKESQDRPPKLGVELPCFSSDIRDDNLRRKEHEAGELGQTPLSGGSKPFVSWQLEGTDHVDGTWTHQY